MNAHHIHIEGIIQGVGFRPHVVRQALCWGIAGWVKNTNQGVDIMAEATSGQLEAFRKALVQRAPPAACIDRITVRPATPQRWEGFDIISSTDDSDAITGICHDLAVCEACLGDMQTQPHRYRYGLINCVNCGPRFSIIQRLPYDRPATTMADFELCSHCHAEYHDLNNRRFHAQPIGCNHCGPAYTFFFKDRSHQQMPDILRRMVDTIQQGGVMAVKGLGGYHLLCDARQESAVARLRTLKERDGKPLAVMLRDVAAVQARAFVNPAEQRLLTDVRRPIVLLRLKTPLAPGVTQGLNTLGVMLPYMPLHHLLFERLPPEAVLVMTSANRTAEPVLIDDQKVHDHLGADADGIVSYNRRIYNRVDDSVALVVNDTPRLVRRARGYAPNAHELGMDCNGIVAAGAELVNCFAIGKDTRAILSQHIGDLQNPATLEFFSETLTRFQQLFRVRPQFMAADMHPDYLSRRFADASGLPVLAIQHHHAHVAAVMAEHQLTGPVIGVAWDGAGYGLDGQIWGGEFLVGDYGGFERVSQIDYMPAPGGDRVVQEPWRMTLAWLRAIGQTDVARWPQALQALTADKAAPILYMLDHQINSPLTSSAGRLFDAVAALTGACSRPRFHAEAPMRLESLLDDQETGTYPFTYNSTLDFRDTFDVLYRNVISETPLPIMAARFHNTLVRAIYTVVQSIHRHTGVQQVVLAGGVFQNRYVLSQTEKRLRKAGFKVFAPCRFPANDGGLALGQLAVAAHRRLTVCV